MGQVFPNVTCNNHSLVVFVCGLKHYEVDVTVWKSSIVGVDAFHKTDFFFTRNMYTTREHGAGHVFCFVCCLHLC